MTTDFRAGKMASKTHIFSVGAAAGCDLLILTFKTKSKDRSLRQLLRVIHEFLTSIFEPENRWSFSDRASKVASGL